MVDVSSRCSGSKRTRQRALRVGKREEERETDGVDSKSDFFAGEKFSSSAEIDEDVFPIFVSILGCF